MAVYLTLTCLVLLISFMVKVDAGEEMAVTDGYNLIYSGQRRRQVKTKAGLVSIFILLFLVSALRINVGNDYGNYVEFMHRAFCDAIVPTEPGFNYLTKIVYTIFGFENFVAVFAIFTAATMFFFLKGIYELTDDFFMSFMMFMLLGYYFQSISTVRYYLALGIALYSISFFMKKNYPAFVILILCGALFHKSLLVVLVLYPLASLKWKRWMLGAAGAMCLSCLFFDDLYLKIAIKLYPSYAGTEYLTGGTSKVNILRTIAVLVLSIIVYRKNVTEDREKNFYFYCNLMALALYLFASFLPTISRIAYYLTVTHIIYIPKMLLELTGSDDAKTRRLGKAFKILTIVGCILYFIMYMRGAADDGVRILPYKTFLFNEMPATLSERGFG